MKQALGISAVDGIGSFGRASVALELLVSFQGKTKPDRVRAQHALRSIENEQSLRFVEAQACHVRASVRTEFVGASGQECRDRTR